MKSVSRRMISTDQHPVAFSTKASRHFERNLTRRYLPRNENFCRDSAGSSHIFCRVLSHFLRSSLTLSTGLLRISRKVKKPRRILSRLSKQEGRIWKQTFWQASTRSPGIKKVSSGLTAHLYVYNIRAIKRTSPINSQSLKEND